MAIQYIKVGQISNDGTGDDLRVAFQKVNDNFEELDLRLVEETIIENSGTIGAGVYFGKVSGIETFKRIIPGSRISVVDSGGSITITASDAIDELTLDTDNGSLVVGPGQVGAVYGGDGIETSQDGQSIIVSLDNNNIVASDTNPTLSNNLNANLKNINDAGTISANTFKGYLEGLVYGFDVRDFGPFLSGFDFGNIRNTYNNALSFILYKVDLDFANITPESADEVDLGSIT